MINRLYAEIFNHALEAYYFNCENGKNNEAEIKVLNSVTTHLYGIAFCADDRESMEVLRVLIEKLRTPYLPRPFNIFIKNIAEE
ncbi:TPA: hypothetical protein NIU80_004855 [Klebsiella variicola]|nr:hypothetical protein [Klebsiella variicola]